MATLAVHEAMGAKVDREAIATLVLPQLWAMSMGPRKFCQNFVDEIAKMFSPQCGSIWPLHVVSFSLDCFAMTSDVRAG